MKSFILVSALMISFLSTANAAPSKAFHCVETEKSKKEYGYLGTFDFQITGKKMNFTAKRKDHNTANGVAIFDKEFTSQIRYIDSEALSSTADGDASIFVSKKLLSTGKGLITLSGSQPNESDTGPDVIWYVNAIMSCEELLRAR